MSSTWIESSHGHSIRVGDPKKEHWHSTCLARWCPHLRLVTIHHVRAAYNIITLRHSRPLGGYYYWGHCVVSELISVSDGPAVTRQHATGSHLSHCRNDLNWRKKRRLLRIWTENSKIPLNLLLESNYTSDTSQCFELIKNSLRWVHEGQGLKDCQDVERLGCPGPVLTNANHCLLSCKSAGRAGEWPWVTRVTPHSIVDTFYWYLLAVKLTRQGPLSPPILFIVTFTALKSSLQWSVWTQGGSPPLQLSPLLSWCLVTGCKCWQLFQDTRQSK